ncbi:MAG TPA: S8 family serine peptidase, partial [Bacteroidia bacterium]
MPLFSQTQIKEFEDGKIFVRTEILQDEIPSVDAKVNLNEVYFLDENTISQFGIFAISKPFYRTKDKSLRTIYLIEFSEVNRIDELISKLNRNPLLEYAEHVPVLHDFFIPNDLGPNNDTTDGQWYLYNINAINAWDHAQGDSNIVVAVVDAGTYIIHDDLKDGIWKNHAEIPNNGIDDDNNGYVDDINGFHPHLNSSNVLPNSLDNNHGTHMSGLVGATNNNGIGIASIAGGVKIMPVTGNGSLERLLGVVYAVDAGARVINMSWGVVSPYASTSVYSVIKYAHDRDVIMVCGAGNFYGLTVSYPAAFDEVITVTARDINNERADFASHGTWVNLSAPGVNILSTSIGSDSSSIYRLESGTSCSSALVSGVVGLMLSANPYLSKANVEHCLYSTAIPVNDVYNGLMGHGRVNALDAVLCAKSFLNLPPDIVVTASDSQICNMNLIKFHSWSNAGPEVNRTWSFPGGTPSSSNLKNPIVAYNSPGTYDVQLIASNNFGADTILLQNFVNVGVPNEQIIFKEDFEKTPKVSIHNPD